MRKSIGSIAALSFLAAASCMATRAHAQTTGCEVNGVAQSIVPGTEPVSCDVSPHGAWYTGSTNDGTGVYLYCEWKPGADGRPEFDPRYSEIAARNDSHQYASRLQHIGNIWRITKATDLHGESATITALVGTMDENGNITGPRLYDINTIDDTQSNPRSGAPYQFVKNPQSVIEHGHAAEGYCRKYVDLLAVGGSITNGYYDPKKANAWYGKRVQSLDLK